MWCFRLKGFNGSSGFLAPPKSRPAHQDNYVDIKEEHPRNLDVYKSGSMCNSRQTLEVQPLIREVGFSVRDTFGAHGFRGFLILKGTNPLSRETDLVLRRGYTMRLEVQNGRSAFRPSAPWGLESQHMIAAT